MIIEYTTVIVGEYTSTIKVETDCGVSKVSFDLSDLKQIKITQHFDESEKPTLGVNLNPFEELKIGDRVSINPVSEYYDNGYANPKGLGTITTIDECDSLGIYVDWDDDTTNAYSRNDLVKEI